MCPAVRVAEHAGEMLDAVGVVVCPVVGGIGGVLWYPVRGLMGLWLGGYVLEVCVVSAEVGDLEGWQVRCALVYCLVVDLTIFVLVPVGLLFRDVELDVGGKAAKGFPEQQCLGAEGRCGGSVEWLPCYAEEQVCVDSGVYHEPDPRRCAGGGRVGGPRFRRWRRPWPPALCGRRPRRWCGPCGGPCGSVPRCGLAAGWPPR